MNKKLYRLIFSKTKGMLVAVAEFTRSHQAESGTASTLKPRVQQISQLSAVSFGILLALGNVQTAQANIIADPGASAGQQPGIIFTPSGAVQVDIQAPSAAGVSRNIYNEFNVDRQGVVLNNSQNGAMTQLAGQIAGNAALAQGAAKIILNEVNSLSPSQLNGMIEVAGQKAQVIIANPAGITCDGCGFINANRATLTTGQAQLENGALTGYLVNDGEIIVQGAGMNASSQDYTDIIARSVKVNASLHAGDLRITTGRNQVDADNQQITKLDSEATATPALALDVSNLGGMYAGKITLVGTEKGVGVNNAGSINSDSGEVKLSADGDIYNSGYVNSGKEIMLAGDNIINSAASLMGARKVTLKAESTIKNEGYISSVDKVALIASDIENHGDVGTESTLEIKAKNTFVNSGVIATNLDVDISATSIENLGNITARQSVSLNAEDIKNKGEVSAEHLVEIQTSKLDNRQGKINSSDTVIIKADAIENSHGSIYAKKKMDLAVTQLNNEEGSILLDNVQPEQGALPPDFNTWDKDGVIHEQIRKAINLKKFSSSLLNDVLQSMYHSLASTGEISEALVQGWAQGIWSYDQIEKNIGEIRKIAEILTAHWVAGPATGENGSAGNGGNDNAENVQPDEGTDAGDNVQPDEGTDIADNVQPDEGTDIADNAEPDEGTDIADNVEPDQSTDIADNAEPDQGTDPTDDQPVAVPVYDLTDKAEFNSWAGINSIYKQIAASVNTDRISDSMLNDMLQYMYLTLQDKEAISNEVVQAWTQAIWGMGASAENSATVKAIADIMTVQWQTPTVVVPKPEKPVEVIPGESSLPVVDVSDSREFDRWEQDTQIIAHVLSAIDLAQLPAANDKGQYNFLYMVSHYIYQLASMTGSMPDEQQMKELAKKAWGLGVTEENIKTLEHISDKIGANM